ncbi:hypothetical protein GC163_05650 [bacterium]|nr:hypothetical protein [bacterium]
MTTSCHVLVIDGSSDTADVLQAVLEPRGAIVQRTRRQVFAQTNSRPADADVVVLDMDDPANAAVLGSEALGHARQIRIGSDRVMVADSQTRFLQKPFQYPELVQAVEELLADSARNPR